MPKTLKNHVDTQKKNPQEELIKPQEDPENYKETKSHKTPNHTEKTPKHPKKFQNNMRGPQQLQEVPIKPQETPKTLPENPNLPKETPNPPIFHVLPGNLDSLQTFAVAAVLGLPRCRVEGTLQATMSLLLQCLGTGEDVALVLEDIGVLLVERRKVRMRFYHDFLEAVARKENLENGVFKVRGLRAWGQRSGVIP